MQSLDVRTCTACGLKFMSNRASRKTCSAACRQMQHRSNGTRTRSALLQPLSEEEIQFLLLRMGKRTFTLADIAHEMQTTLDRVQSMEGRAFAKILNLPLAELPDTMLALRHRLTR